ncbi:hypothetical protein DFR86_02025 [Acidianus sulfidivorans JP7]|uniref:Uncharacterized protein n=1 Tax=Acidianus sulfidivorans JP7 TaxID=619593 RepID=A0A2U9IKD3_9CREN|nr:hypothetical protein [Acidianus sulfidivorans]AWR96445.1 hypothetical protein DFR86_02025 [Acidianus sulfidivorans JP7]
MLSFLIGSPAPSWYDLKDMFQDYSNVAVYVNDDNNIEMIKVSDIDDFFLPTSVLVDPEYLKKMHVYYLKMRKYVAFPTFNLQVVRYLVQLKRWRAIEYYSEDHFKGSWVLYDCEGEKCEEKQIKHLKIKDCYNSINEHIKIFESDK